MGIRQVLGRSFGRAALSLLRGKDDPLATPGWSVMEGVLPQSSSGAFTSLSVQQQETAARNAVVVYLCVKKLCETANESPPRVGLEGPRGWEDDSEHPVNALLRAPNLDMDWATFEYHLVAHLQLTGAAYCWKWRGPNLDVNALWPIPTSWVRPLYSPDSKLLGYSLWQGEQKPRLTISTADLFRIYYPDPADLRGQLGPLQAASRTVQLDTAREDFMGEVLANWPVTGPVFTQSEEWGEDQRKDFEKRIMRALGPGSGGRGRPLFLSGEGAKVSAPEMLKDLDWPGLSSLTETRVCAAFGVPPILLNLRSGLERSTYSNFAECVRSFYAGTASALWQKLDAGLTRGLLRYEESLIAGAATELEIYHETAEVRGLREDANTASERAARLFAGSAISRNEARAMVGLEALPPEQGDVYLVPVSVVEVPAAQIGAAIPPAPPDTGANANAVL